MTVEIDLNKTPKLAAFLKNNLEKYIQEFHEEEEMEKH